MNLEKISPRCFSNPPPKDFQISIFLPKEIKNSVHNIRKAIKLYKQKNQNSILCTHEKKPGMGTCMFIIPALERRKQRISGTYQSPTQSSVKIRVQWDTISKKKIRHTQVWPWTIYDKNWHYKLGWGQALEDSRDLSFAHSISLGNSGWGTEDSSSCILFWE